MNAKKEETTQTVGKMKFVVVSQYKENGSTPCDKIKKLLEREVQEKNGFAEMTDEVKQNIIKE
jgi:hypothetical protein